MATKAPSAPTRPALDTVLFGDCKIARSIIEGGDAPRSGGSTADWWHDKCLAATHNGPATWLCSDPWHDENPKCSMCREPYTVEEAADGFLTSERTCADYEGCHERQADRRQTPRMAVVAECLRKAEIEKAEKKERRDPDTPSRSRSPRLPKTSGQGRVAQAKPATILDCRCEHCGEPTKGGKFVAGHDAKLKGLLLEAGKALDPDAVAEMLTRGWVKQGTRDSILAWRRKLLKDNGNPAGLGALAEAEVKVLFEEADVIIQGESSLVLLTRRVNARVQ